MKNAIVTGDLRVEPGQIGLGKLEGPGGRTTEPTPIPLMVVNGAQDGPTIWIQAAIHGLEVPGIELVRRLVREVVDPKQLRGVIKAVPAINVYAYAAGQQFAPQDQVDAHAVSPGDPTRSISHRLARLIYEEGIMKCDYFIDLHSNYWPAIMFLPVPVGGTQEVVNRSVAMAEAFGLAICEVKNAPGWPSSRSQLEGKPAFVVELGYHGWVDQNSVEVGLKGMLNVLRFAGMLEGEIEKLPAQKVPPGYYGRGFIFSKHGGLVRPLKDAGDWISKGEVVAVIRDLYGDVVEEVTSPGDGYVRTVLFGNLNQAINAGEIVYSYMISGPKESYFVVSQ